MRTRFLRAAKCRHALLTAAKGDLADRAHALLTAAKGDPADRAHALLTAAKGDPADRAHALLTAAKGDPADRAHALLTAAKGDPADRAHALLTAAKVPARASYGGEVPRTRFLRRRSARTRFLRPPSRSASTRRKVPPRRKVPGIGGTRLPALALRPMVAADIPAVVALDRLSFATPWSAAAFRHEVCVSNYSYMLILESSSPQPSERGWQEWRPWRPRRRHTPAQPGGYGGLWVIEDEGHISTLAVQPCARGERWGELLLTALIQRALTAGASYIVLEVRVSNLIAQALYRKYSFAIVERRARYYADSEDAFAMRLDLDAPTIARFQQMRAALWRQFAERQGLRDHYTGAPWPEATTTPR